MHISLYRCVFYRFKMLLKQQERDVPKSDPSFPIKLGSERQKDFGLWCSFQRIFSTFLGQFLAGL